MIHFLENIIAKTIAIKTFVNMIFVNKINK